MIYIMVRMLPLDMLFEIARNIKDLNTFLTFTACSRSLRELLYNHSITRYLRLRCEASKELMERRSREFCIVISNYVEPSIEISIFAEEIGAFIEANKNCVSVMKTIYSYPYVLFQISNIKVSRLICSNCAITYKFTRNERFLSDCSIYTDDERFAPRECSDCSAVVCRKKGYYDFAGNMHFGTQCLKCGPSIRMCEKCNKLPITRYYSTSKSTNKCMDCA